MIDIFYKLLLAHTSLSLSLSVCFNGYFRGGPGLVGAKMYPFWMFLELRLMEVAVITGAIRRAKLQSNRHHQQTSPVFYRPDVLPVTQPTVSEH